MPGVDFDVVRRAIAMRQVLDEIGFRATRHEGDQLRGPCLVHGSSRAWLRVQQQPSVFSESRHAALLLSQMQITWQPT